MRFRFFTLFTLLTLIMLIAPVSAGYEITGVFGQGTVTSIDNKEISNLQYNATPERAISRIGFWLPLGTTVNFTLNYGTSGSVSGWMIYRAVSIGQSYSEVSIGDVTYSENFIDAQAAGYSLTKHLELTAYAKNETSSDVWQTGIAIYDPWYGITSKEIAFYPVDNIGINLINSISMTASQNIDIKIETGKVEDLSVTASQTWWDSLKNTFGDYYAYAGIIKDVFISVIYWLKLIFVDNIVGVAALYFIGTAAYAANTSKDIFQFFTRWFRLQRSFIDFMIGGFYFLVNMVSSFLAIFKP